MAAEVDAVKVCLRVRPIIQREQGDQVNLVWKAENSTVSQIDGTRSFHFDRVFGSLETTTQVYQEVAVPIIRSALHGYNGTIFAYGQTSSGKTYTMMGTPNTLGIIPQAVKEVFRIIQEIPNREFLLRVSYMEIYNETVTDLLCDSRKKKPLDVREDINRNVYVAGLTEELVMSPEHVLQWIKKGEKNRHYGETKMNERSSRSHTIFRMIVESRESNDPGNSENCDGAVMVSHLNLVDLAGSERASQTGAEGVRLKEGCHINRSLFIIGQVIKKLSDDQPGVFINYRDSKLTRILQNSLGGNTKTVIICTITPVSFEETLSTLQFASAAKNVKNKPHVNEVLDDEALLKRYRKEIMDLKKQLEDLEESSVSKTNAMAKEEHSQLLAVIQQLQKDKAERISNLKNIVIDAAVSQEEQPKRKRRVTWAAEKIKSTLYNSGVIPFDDGSKLGASFPKRAKTSHLQTLPEHDDSVVTEFSDNDETTHVFEDFYPEWNFGSGITSREKSAFHHSMIDPNSDAQLHSSTLLKDSSSPKNNEVLEQKLAELADRLKTIAKDHAAEVEKRESFEKETLKLKQQLEAKEEEKDMLVNAHHLEITSLKDQLQNGPESNEMRVGLEVPDQLEVLDSNLTLSRDKMNISDRCTQTDQEQETCDEEHLSSQIHDIHQEQIMMLEQKIVDLETSNSQSNFVESLQICDALMLEKETALNELAILREDFDSVVVENESLKQEVATMEKYLQEKNETNEFEVLEKETQREQEAQLIHEIGNLKKLVENAELYNQELEAKLENQTNVLKDQEKQIAELKKDTEELLKKARYSDLATSMGGDSEKLCEEVFHLKQSMADAETITRDAQREAAFLRSENLELKEKMDEFSLRCQQREKDASAFEKQLEAEKSNYKRMQADLQKELQCAFNEINQLNGLMAGRVPKDLLSRVELEKKIADCSKQLITALEEKNSLGKEVAYLSELKSLPREIEQLQNQIQKASEELHLFQNEKEQSDSLISDQNSKMQEQKEQMERLTEEVTNTQSKFQQAEQQHSELKILYEDLQTRCSLADEEIKKKSLEAECLVTEINRLKTSLELLEGELFRAQQEREEMVQAQQERASQTSSMEEMLKSTESERDDLQKQLSSLVETLQQQEEMQSELVKEKQELEQKHLQLMSEKEQLEEQLSNLQPSLNIMQTETSEAKLKLQELQEEMTLLAQQRDELQSKVEELAAEKAILKQDLNDNIEMSVETQDELRTTQEELKSQKQLVADLRKQISDYAERISLQAESHENTPEASKADSETIAEENQSFITEMEALKERVESAELAIATMEGDKNELLQKRYALEEDLLSVTEQRDQLENTKNSLLKEKNDLRDEVQRTTKQVCELNEELQHLSEKQSHDNVTVQLPEQIEEKQKLLETLKAVTEERDQLKLDLHDNIEMSIETQEELRNALGEVKEKSRLLDALKSQVNGSYGRTNNLEKDPKAEAHDLQEQLLQKTSEYEQLLQIKNKLEEDKNSQNCEPENLANRMREAQMSLESLQNERHQTEEQLLGLQQKLKAAVQDRCDLEVTNERLIVEMDQLKRNLKEKDSGLQEQLLQKTFEYEQLLKIKNEIEEDKGGLNCEVESLTNRMREAQMSLESLQNEKHQTEEQLLDLQQKLKAAVQDRCDLEITNERLIVEMDQLKGNLKENDEMSIKIQVDLRSTQEELQHQRERVSELAEEISSLEQKSSSLEKELHETTVVLKEVTCERDDLDQSKQTLTSEVDQLLQQLKDKKLSLEQAEKEKSEASQKLFELTSVLSSMAEEKDQLNCSKEDVEKQSFEMQNDLIKTQEELQQQKEKVESLTSKIALLEEKLSSLQSQLQENIALLKAAVEEKEMLDQTRQKLSSDIERVMESLKSKDTILELTESGKRIDAQKVLELTEEVRTMSREKEQLQLLKENLEGEATKLMEDFKQLQHRHAELREQETQKSGKLEELLLEIEQLREKVTLKDTTAQQLEMDKADLQRKVQQDELEVASLHQEQEQFQQLLQRARSEKENICTNLQDQEKANEHLKESLTICQTALESVKKQRDESKDNLAEKVNEVNAMLQQLSSLEQQLQLLQQKLKDEWRKNNVLSERVSDLEKEIRVLRLIQNEPAQEQDEIEERTEMLQQKNEELKDLMVNISTVYANHYRILSTLSVELQAEVEAQKQSMCSIKESLPSTDSREFATLQTEYIKLSTQLQTLLNQFKVIYRNAAVKEEQYSLVNGYDSDLCAVQKENDEMLLRCQNLEQNGTKWFENAVEELKFCEREFLSHLIFKKMDVMKCVEDGLSEVQVTLNSVEGDLKEEVKDQKQFLSWLEELEGLHFDAKKCSEGIIQENKRLSGFVQLLARNLKVIVQSRIKRDTVAYLKKLDENLQEKKKKNKELLQKMQGLAPSGDYSILKEENAQLCEELKNLQAELKKMQCRIQQLENEVSSVNADAKEKGEKASLLQEKLLSSSRETELSEMRANCSEKEKLLETALKEMKALQEKVTRGGAPYRDEIDHLKSQLVKLQMDRIKLTKSTDQQIASLRSCIDYKEESLRKLKEQLRRSQQDTDTTICSEKAGPTPYPVTCGGGSGIVQSTAMLMLQSENAALKREITQCKKKCHQLSRNASSREDELKKIKDRSIETPSNLFSSLVDSSQCRSETYRQVAVSPRKSDIPLRHIRSPGKTGIHKHAVSSSRAHLPRPEVVSPSRAHLPRPEVVSPSRAHLPRPEVMSSSRAHLPRPEVMSSSRAHLPRPEVMSPSRAHLPRPEVMSPSRAHLPRPEVMSPSRAHLPRPEVMSPSRAHLPRPEVMSPNKTLRHSVPASSPGKSGPTRKRPLSPFKTEGLFSNLTESPCKKQSLPEPASLDKFFERSKSLPYCPSKFFDNSTLGTLQDADMYSGSNTETNEVKWWDRTDTTDPDCKTS